MNAVDLILIALIAAAFLLALRAALRKKGGCGCGCAGCTRSCARRETPPPDRNS